MPPADAHKMSRTGILALYDQRSKCADLQQGFETFTVTPDHYSNDFPNSFDAISLMLLLISPEYSL